MPWNLRVRTCSTDSGADVLFVEGPRNQYSRSGRGLVVSALFVRRASEVWLRAWCLAPAPLARGYALPCPLPGRANPLRGHRTLHRRRPTSPPWSAPASHAAHRGAGRDRQIRESQDRRTVSHCCLTRRTSAKAWVVHWQLRKVRAKYLRHGGIREAGDLFSKWSDTYRCCS
jgi:hypothetical protein